MIIVCDKKGKCMGKKQIRSPFFLFKNALGGFGPIPH